MMDCTSKKDSTLISLGVIGARYGKGVSMVEVSTIPSLRVDLHRV